MNFYKNGFIKIILVLSIFLLSFNTRAQEKLTFSLEEAILLSLRKNPNVQNAKMDHLLAKWNTYIQEWEFKPHYGLLIEGSAASNQTGPEILRTRKFNFKPSVSLKTAYGTKFDLAFTNTATSHYNPGLSLDISQPLLKGFGSAIVQAALNNARDSEIISRMSVEETLRTTVTAVINAYLDVVSAERTVKIDEEALKRAQQSVLQTKKFIQAGRKAGNELVTVQANVASANAQLENDKNLLVQQRYALLSAIGIDPNTNIIFTPLNIGDLLKKYAQLPSLPETKLLVLNNNLQYQTDLITLYGEKTRSLATAKNNTYPQLNFTVNATSGSGIGGKENSGIESLWNGYNQGQSATLSLEVPIDDQAAKQQLLSAQIALKEARLNLEKNRWGVETNAINAWNGILSAERSLRYAKEAENLQQKTYNISYQKYLYGLIDSLELQSAQVQLIQAETGLVNAQINYIKSLVNLDALIGRTLKTWHVNVRLR